jgi:protein-S-isoprenylcysteine O-methyltransferase Ste14
MNERSASVVATAALVVVVIAMFRMGVLLAPTTPGLVVQGVAVALMLWARVTFGRRSFHFAANPTAGGLVTWGPYRWFRHPIYAAVLLFLWTAVATHPSRLTLALGVAATAATAVRMRSEERLLVQRYPEYGEYAARTKRIVPGLF